jgi:hypothetical protein
MLSTSPRHARRTRRSEVDALATADADQLRLLKLAEMKSPESDTIDISVCPAARLADLDELAGHDAANRARIW